MNEASQEYIEAYFKGQLNEAEKRQFEERCVQDELFAKEVAFYITTREAAIQKLLEQKRQQWSGMEDRSITNIPTKIILLRKWLPYTAAACLLIAVALYFTDPSNPPQQLANKYVTRHFTQLSQTMDASEDTLQRGIAAYNNKDYNTALQLFEKIYQSNPSHSKAKKFIGLVYLITKNYDKALLQFEELAGQKDLYKNPGLFLKAVTLLQRNKQGDKEQAKQLLKQVVNEKTEGSREAKKWLEKWD